MKKVAIADGASNLAQKIASQFLRSGWDVLCIDDLSKNPGPLNTRLLKRDVLEVGPLEMALKKETADLLIFIPRSFTSEQPEMMPLEFHVNSFLGFLKVAEKIKAPELVFVVTKDLPTASKETCFEIIKSIQLKSKTNLKILSEDELLSEKNAR